MKKQALHHPTFLLDDLAKYGFDVRLVWVELIEITETISTREVAL
jgi:hypothetical protein